ncbi:hypothetical protein [Capillimicrobium parvum]|nr:hypothetical protein [Capillimicrobium parvum]
MTGTRTQADTPDTPVRDAQSMNSGLSSPTPGLRCMSLHRT